MVDGTTTGRQEENDLESPDDCKKRCIQMCDEIIVYLGDVLDVFSVSSRIPRELRISAENCMIMVFGPDSSEWKRYNEYSEFHASLDFNKRKAWVTNLLHDFNAARRKLEHTPVQHYKRLGYGGVDNQIRDIESVAQRLDIVCIEGGSQYSRRVVIVADRIESCIKAGSYDGAGFYLRKLLESTIIMWFRTRNRESEIRQQNGDLLPLNKILSQKMLAPTGPFTRQLVDDLKDRKIFLDSSVHDLYYDPSLEDINLLIGYIKIALQKMEANSL